MITTMIIGVPSAIKTFNWLGTLYKGNIHYTAAMMNALAFVAMFVIGGLSGIWMACTPVDMYIHDTYFIVAHIHYVLFGGSLFGIFAGITYWYPKMFGRMMNEKLGKVHFWITFVAFNCTFFPMHILGMAGHMRRIYNPQQYDFLKPIIPHQRIHFDQRLRARRGAVHAPGQYHLQLLQGCEGHRESVEREHAGVDHAVTAAARQLAWTGADRLSWTVRVQLARGRGGLSAAIAVDRALDGGGGLVSRIASDESVAN